MEAELIAAAQRVLNGRYDADAERLADYILNTLCENHDTRRLDWFALNCGIDGFGEIDDLHAKAFEMAPENADGPTLDKALADALRAAIDIEMVKELERGLHTEGATP